MKIYSKKGDSGKTQVSKTGRTSKNDIRIHFLGETDELISRLGLIKAMMADENARAFEFTIAFIEDIQKKLMSLTAHIYDPNDKNFLLSKEDVSVLENEIDRITKKIKKEFKFVMPGKNTLEAQMHLARTAARKTERLFTAVIEQKVFTKDALCINIPAYLNRLSDYLFILTQSV